LGALPSRLVVAVRIAIRGTLNFATKKVAAPGGQA